MELLLILAILALCGVVDDQLFGVFALLAIIFGFIGFWVLCTIVLIYLGQNFGPAYVAVSVVIILVGLMWLVSWLGKKYGE